MHLGKKTKIVATIGPATESQDQLEKALKAGLNVIRMNFAHGDFAEHQRKVDNGRAASKKTGIPVAFMQDLCGPQIRMGDFGTPTGRVTLKTGQTFTFITKKILGDENQAYMNYDRMPQEVQKGHRVFLDDAKLKLEVVKTDKTSVTCKVIVGGEIKGRRTVNLPDTTLTISSITPKDKADLEFGIKNKLDWIAISFVRSAAHVNELRAILKKKGLDAKIMSKVESAEGVANIDEIIEATDGVMVARGDLGSELPVEEVPLIQKMMIDKCNRAGKAVVVATQVLMNMIKSSVPTRAEVSDIANSVLDGADAVMLSEESTIGDYPIKCMEVMARVSKRVENDLLHEKLLLKSGRVQNANLGESTASSAAHTAQLIGAKCILSLTEYGYGPRMTARHRCHSPIVALTPNEKVRNQLCMYFGVWPVLVPKAKDFESAIKYGREVLLKEKIVKKGDKIVVITGIPFGKATESNLVHVEVI